MGLAVHLYGCIKKMKFAQSFAPDCLCLRHQLNANTKRHSISGLLSNSSGCLSHFYGEKSSGFRPWSDNSGIPVKKLQDWLVYFSGWVQTAGKAYK